MARTQGTFQQIYEAAREFMVDGHGKPMDPVVRYNEATNTWALESRMTSIEDESWEFEISLDDFISHWWEGLNDAEWIPTEESIRVFANA